jgi:hypothetical protein
MTVASPGLVRSSDAGRAAVRGGVRRVLGYGIGVLLTVGSAAVLFRHLGVVDARHYVLVLSLITLAGMVIAEIGLPATNVQNALSTCWSPICVSAG